MRKSKNNLIAAMLIVGLVGGVMVGAYVVTTPGAQRVSDDMRRQRDRGETVPTAQGQHVQTLTPRMGSDRRLEFDLQQQAVPKGVEKRVFAVNEYLRKSKIAPPDARCLGIDVHDGIAHLSFNRAFLDGQGSDDEAILINGILATMSQFEGIEKVQFEVDGKPIDTFGHFDLSTAQSVIPLES